MDNQKQKCSSIQHNEIDAIYYCVECKVYMCNKCHSFHSELCQNHHSYNLDKNINEIFIGICKEENHFNELEYFCKTHNQLCCASCITIIKSKKNGQHKDCEICLLEDIKEEKKNNLEKNVKTLEDLTNNLLESINKIKNIFEKLNEKKDELKLQIQNEFTELRNKLNEREDELIIELEKYFDKLYFNKDLVKKSEKLPNNIKKYLQNIKIIDKDWDDINKLGLIINNVYVALEL